MLVRDTGIDPVGAPLMLAAAKLEVDTPAPVSNGHEESAKH